MSDGGELHPLVVGAAEGRLPEWAVVGKRRRAHMMRVAKLMRRWSEVLGQSGDDVRRWTALGYLHDALRDADPEELRRSVPASLHEFPDPVLHGPAAAQRLREHGVDDEAMLTAIAYHTLGSPELDGMGRALYAADFLEPGRTFRIKWRREMRKRMPEQLDGVVRALLGARIRHLVERERPVRVETMAFWNRMVTGRAWASASEV